MKEFINILINNKKLKRVSMITMALLIVLMGFLFQSTSDLPFVYSQF